jgi:acyl-CoA hydrolase
MDYQREYRRKLVSAAEAAGLVQSGMWIDYGFGCGQPRLIDEELARRAPELERVKIREMLNLVDLQTVHADPRQEHFIHNSWFFSQVARRNHEMRSCSFIPDNFGGHPRNYRGRLREMGLVDIAFIEVTPMDKHGYFNFGGACSTEKAVCDAARTVVVEVNESQPWVYGGYDETIHISEVDYIVENDRHPIAELPVPPQTEIDERIAAHVVEEIRDGATIQLGIGAMPNAICRLLAERRTRDLGIHTEMFTEGMMDLMEAGAVTNAKKSLHKDKAVFTFAFGSRRLYDFIDRNARLAIFPVDYTNNPYVIAQNHRQVAVNSCLKVDLKGQVCSESSGFRQISGTGGQLDFTRGAYMSPGGKAFLCLKATRETKEGIIESNIRTALEPGDTVTTPRSEVHYIATEFGAVNLKGMSSWQTAKLLISIAHPDFRGELEEAALRVNLITPATLREPVR